MVLVPDEMVTMDPPPRAAMAGMAWRARSRAPRVVISIARSQTPRSTPTASVSRRGWLQAALWSTASTRPNSATARSTKAATDSSRRTSQRTPMARPPAASHLLGHRLRALERHVADHHRGALAGQPQRRGAADVGGTAADQHHLAVELSPSGAMGPS